MAMSITGSEKKTFYSYWLPWFLILFLHPVTHPPPPLSSPGAPSLSSPRWVATIELAPVYGRGQFKGPILLLGIMQNMSAARGVCGILL